MMNRRQQLHPLLLRDEIRLRTREVTVYNLFTIAAAISLYFDYSYICHPFILKPFLIKALSTRSLKGQVKLLHS